MSFYASYPVTGGSGGGTVPTYASFAVFPSAAGVGNGALAIALDTNILYESNGSTWLVLANPSYSGAITALTGDVTATGPGSAAATIANLAVTNAKIANATINLTTKVTGVLPVANGGTNSSTALNNNRFIISSGGAIVEQSALTASRAVVTDGSGLPAISATTSTEIGYVSGVTSSIQTQLDGKVPTTRTISTTSPLTGGGALSSDLTLAVTSGNLTAAGTDGIAVTGGTGSVLGSGTSIAQQKADSTHNGYLSSADWTTFNGKQASGNYITALTGDVTATGPGSVAGTLATVNSNVGTFGNATNVGQFTVNGKGLVTAASNVLITGALSSPLDAKNYGFTTSVGSSQFTINLKNNAGSDPSSTDPCVFAFRNATSATGTYSIVTATAATSLVISSGATLGQTSAVASYFYVYVLNNSGTAELAVSTKKFDDGSIVSTTTMSGSATSSTVMYSTTGRSNVAIKLIGRILTTQATAGTWASNATEISLGTSFLTSGTYGVTQGLSIPAGQIGEVLTATNYSATPNLGTSPTAMTSLALTAGSWLIMGTVTYSGTADSSITCAIGTTSASYSGTTFGVDQVKAAITSGEGGQGTILKIVNIAATTTYYFNASMSSTSSNGSAAASMKALRIG